MSVVARALLASLVVAVAACDGPYSFIPPGYQDAATKSRDVVTYLARQRHTQVAFGNAEGGDRAGALVGKQVRIGARVTVTGTGTPQLGGSAMRVGDARETTIPVASATSASVAIEGAARLYRGFGKSGRRTLSVDLLGRAFLTSGLPASDLNVETGAIGAALGVRVGITEEQPNVPAISLVTTQGRLPGFRMASDPIPLEGGGTATMRVDELTLIGTTARVAASKRFGRVGVIVGYGVDVLNVEATIGTTITGRPEVGTGPASDGVDSEIRRTTLFGGASYRLRGVTLGGELGVVGGERGPSELNRFSAGGGSRPYVSVGVRLGN